MNEEKVIAIPPAALDRLEWLIMQRQRIEAQIDGALAMLRGVLDVPDDYQISDVRRGFVPPPEQERLEH